jgi:hypothetical protein
MNQHLTYVALTRHKEDVHIYADTHLFKNQEDLYQSLSQEDLKENALDYVLDEKLLSPLTPEDVHGFINRRYLGALSRTASHAWTTLTRLTHKIWHKAQTWRGIEESSLAQISPSLDLKETKRFTPVDIEKYCRAHHLDHIATEERRPLITHVAEKTYKETKEWLHILETSSHENQLEKQAILTGIYTAWAKSILETYSSEESSVDKAFEAGILAAKLKLNSVSEKNDQKLVLQAIQQSKAFEKYKNPLQEEIAKLNARCQNLTGTPIPQKIIQEFTQTLYKHHNSQTNSQEISQTLNTLRLEKVYGNSHHPQTPENTLPKSIIPQRQERQMESL